MGKLDREKPLYDEQQQIFNTVVTMAEEQTIEDEAKFIVIQGDAGSGKSELLKRLILKIRTMEYEEPITKKNLQKLLKDVVQQH